MLISCVKIKFNWFYIVRVYIEIDLYGNVGYYIKFLFCNKNRLFNMKYDKSYFMKFFFED